MTVVGGAGGRLDHFVANLAVLAAPGLAPLVIDAYMGDARVAVVRGGAGEHRITGALGSLVTLVPVGGDAVGISTTGLEYPLDGEDLPAGTSRGVSNVIAAQPASVTVARRHRARHPTGRRRAMRRAIVFPALLALLLAACGSSAKRRGADAGAGEEDHHGHAARAQLVRGHEERARAVHETDRLQGEDLAAERRRRDGQPGNPAEGPPGCRRDVRRRQHVPHPRARRGHLRPVRRPEHRPGARGVPIGRRATPRDAHRHGDVCVVDDTSWFGQSNRPPAPTTLDDLTKPAYKNLVVVENPATSSPGLAFLLATVAAKGEGGWQDYWRALKANGVRVVDDWEQAYRATSRPEAAVAIVRSWCRTAPIRPPTSSRRVRTATRRTSGCSRRRASSKRSSRECCTARTTFPARKR